MKGCAANDICDWMTCKLKLKNGSACLLRDGVCESGNCEGMLKRLCQPKKEEVEDDAKNTIGAKCDKNKQCTSSHCQKLGKNAGECAPPIKKSFPCAHDDACESSKCKTGLSSKSWDVFTFQVC